MSIGAGAPLAWLKPLDPDGNRTPGRLGCHGGDYEFLNVANPQPGFVYYCAKRKEGRLLSLRRRGYQVVTTDMPERLGELEGILGDAKSTSKDSLVGTQDIVLMRCPIEIVRRRQAERAATNHQSLTGATAEYLNRAAEIGGVYHSPDKPIRFQHPDHRMESR